ncbi:MAG: molybdopterin-dependent oxidoreductase [Gracilibacteraceae bacterium]|jgi:anaerobic selenocysteine-containing dehydrogenase|nr:molybdopterin-dependent oxidoreductase [Gracilibacteraceae bacterium]
MEKHVNCRFCGYQCGLLATVEDGRLIKVRPDPGRFPYDENILRHCRRWPTAPQFLAHPARINFPRKRTGERGAGQFEQISWETALAEISDRLSDLKGQYGAKTLASAIGGPHTTYWPLHRFMTLFGSPNNMGIGQICWNPGVWTNLLMYGRHIDMELMPGITNCAVLWGVNPADSDNSLFWQTVRQFRQNGGELVVIDPRQTATAREATLYLPIQPGADPYLALALLHVVIREKLYDRDFVAEWCHGFPELTAHTGPYSPGEVAGVCGLAAEEITRLARLYAKEPPSTLYTGRGLDQLGQNSLPTHQAIAALRAITGNLDYPGASLLTAMPDFRPEVDFELSAEMGAELKAAQLNAPRLKLQTYAAYEKLAAILAGHGFRPPERYLTSAHPNAVWQAMLKGEPYPVRALIVMAANPLLTQADSRLVHRALHSLDLLVSLELFPTPTAMLADYILPIAGPLEKPVLETKAGIANIAYGGNGAAAPYFERRTDYDFFKSLGERLGQEGRWPWPDYEQALAAAFEPLGLGWDSFCQTGLYAPVAANSYFSYLLPAGDGKERGFATGTGKVELASEFLRSLAEPAIPPPAPLPAAEGFPLRLLTGSRYHPYYASSHRWLPALRRLHPAPWAEMAAQTAAAHGLVEGDDVLVQTERGEQIFTVHITPGAKNTVAVEYGWWFPEETGNEPHLGGMWRANANVLTSGDMETSDSYVGTWTYNGIPCRICKA